MEIDTEYATRLFFPSTSFVQVYFEALANAFDAQATEVKIHISADPLELTITDNGQGFTDDRFDRFARLTHPIDSYHKGLGRLVYLKYFSSVHIVSFYGRTRRSFVFSNLFKGKSQTTEASESERQETTLRFSSFAGQRLRANEDIKPAILKEKIIEQFLPLLNDKKKKRQPFRIDIELISKTNRDIFPDTQSITASDVPTFNCIQFHDKTVNMFSDITMSYVVRQGHGGKSLIAVCVDGRTIPIHIMSLNAIPADCSVIFLFESEMFVGKSDSARQRLVLPEEISEVTLYRALRREVAAVLNKELPEIARKNTSTKQRFEERYPHLTGLFDYDTVGLIDKDEAIDGAQRLFFKKQKEVLESDSLDDATFEKSLEVSSRTLTEYILYRELIIKRLSETTASCKESDIHTLIVPRRQTFHGSTLVDGIYSNNAWLLDDRFMSFRTIMSEATMQEVITAINPPEGAPQDDGRPDIAMIFSADPMQNEKVDVVVVEIKRRFANVKENSYAHVQLVQRAERLVNYWSAIQRVWYFAIIDIDDAYARTLLSMKWTPLFSSGRVFYQEFPVMRTGGAIVPTPIYILSYDAVIQDAAARNHTFLEILKSDIKRALSKLT